MAYRTVAPGRDHRLLPLQEGETIVTALYRAASAVPSQPALMTRGFGRERTIRITYAQLLEHVERIADVLTLCGVRRGESVALQIPNCWGSATMVLACLRIGAVVVPVRQSLGAHEFERVLAGTGASTCVVLDSYLGQRNAETLLTISEHLPALRHRVVVGDASATGALDFERLCRDRTGVWQADGELAGPLPDDLDGPCLVVPDLDGGRLTTLGYRHESLCADALAALGRLPEPHPGFDGTWVTPGEVFGTSYPLNRPFGLLPALWQPVLAAGTGAFVDEWEAGNCLDLFAEARVTRMAHPAGHWAELVAEQRARPRELPGLRDAVCHSLDVPPGLAGDVPDAFGVPLRITPHRQLVADPL